MAPANICSREKLESLLGHLNHACSVVRPGRSFIGRLISLLTEAKRKHRNISRINSEARWWHVFIESWNGISILWQQDLAHPDHELWSDASGSWGAGAFWDSVSVATCHPTSNQRTSPNRYSLCPLGKAVEGHNSESQLWQWGSSDSRINSRYSRDLF